jgi:calpain family cysteine protease
MAAFQCWGQTARAPKQSRFVPGVEQLETRAVPAVTLSLAAGVLTVNGTTGNDSIVLRQANGRVSVDGVTTTYASTSVTSVVVNAGAGNDAVSLSGLKAQPWAKPITVKSAGGDDSVKMLDSRTAFIGGANQTLSIAASGLATLNGKALTWFDYNIHDTALRQLLKTDYADNSLNRADMLTVFNQVKQDGTVSSNEFTDLKAVANNTSLFSSFSYVADLTRDVVLGNSANAHFQGTTLGNLTAGAPASKLNNLVGKWFLGVDHPDASYSGLTVTYATAAGTLFGSGGPKYTDVHQGAVGDCYFVATLGETALRSPATITSMFIVNGDGTYSVRYYQNGVAHYVTVDSQLPTYGGGHFLYANMGGLASNSSNVLWVALAEKAYVQMNESGWLRPSSWGGGINAYSAIAGGLFTDAARQIANRAGSNYTVSGAGDDTALANAVSSGKLIGFASASQPTNSQVVGNHQYIVIAYNTSTKTVTLFNPWGINNGSSYPGLLDLNLSQLVGSFDYWSAA